MVKAGAQRLGAGFLGGKTLGVGCGAARAPFRFGALDVRVKAGDETLAMLFECFLDAADIAEVASETKDHERASSMRVRIFWIDSAKPAKIASPTRKWPILSSRTCGMAATALTLS